VLKLRRKNDHEFLKGEPFHIRGRVDKIHPRRRKDFLAIRFGKVALVLTIEVLRTSHIRWFLCGVCKGGNLPEVLGSGEDMECLIVGTHVHRSRVVQKFGYPKELDCGCGSVKGSQSFEAQNEF